jgi:hypothetical protein
MTSRESAACWVRRARQRQQSIDEAGQTVDFLEHAADDAAVRRLVTMPAKPDLADAANRA